MMIDLGNSPTLTKENLSQIHIPVTILLGGKDNMVTQNESKEAASYLPNGQFKILPEQPHPIEGVDIKLIIESLSP